MSPEPLSGATISAYLSLLGSEHGDYRQAIQWFREHEKEARPHLLRALQAGERPSLQKRRIIEALGELRAEEALPWLSKTLQSGMMLWECAQAIAKIGSLEAELVLRQALQDPRLPIVKECTRALGHIHSKTVGTALQGQLQHKDASVRHYALQSLVQCQAQGLGELLIAHLDTEQDPELRSLIQAYLSSKAF